MKIMQLSENEIRAQENELRNLWRDCFGDTENYMDFYFEQKPVDSVVFALYEKELYEEELCSMLWLNPYTIRMNGETFTGYYIVGVATKKECRGRGYMKALILESFAFMYEKKNPFTYLMPAAEAIYSPYDFRFIYDKESMEQQLNDMNGQDDTTSVLEWDSLSSEQREETVKMTNELLKREFDVYVVRSLAYFERLNREMKACDGAVLVLMCGAKVTAIVPYMHESEIVEVSEVIMTPDQKLNCLKEYFNEKFEGIVKTIKFLETHFIEKKENKIVKNPMIMGRIIHMKQYLSNLSVAPGSRTIIKVRDSWIRENNHNYVIKEKNGMTVVEETKEDADICMDIAEWTRFFFGTNDISIQEVSDNQLETINKSGRVYINEIV